MDRRSFARGTVFLLVAPGLGKFLVSCTSEVELPPARGDAGEDHAPAADTEAATDAPSAEASDAEASETIDAFDGGAESLEDVVVFTSSVYVSHAHTFGVARALLDGPATPSSDLGGETSVASGHAHTMMVTVAQLKAVQAGGTVVVTSGRTNAHTHDFTFTRV